MRVARALILVALLVPLGADLQEAGAKPSQKRAVKIAGKPPQMDTPAYQDACITFAENRYKDAATKFEKLDRSGFCNEKTHYYLAQCYQNMNQNSIAQQHYQWVLAYGKDPTLRSYAQVAYGRLGYFKEHSRYSGQGNVFASVGTGFG